MAAADKQYTVTPPGRTGITGKSAITAGATTISAAYDFNAFTGEELTQIINETLAPRVTQLANKASIFISRVPKMNSTPMNPRGIRIATEKRPNASQIFYAEAGALSKGDGREYLSMNVFYSRFSQGGRLSLDALQAMNKGQALETLKTRMMEDTKDALRFMDFEAFGNGEGTRGVVNGAVGSSATPSVVFDAPLYAKGLQVGGRYDVHDGTTKAKLNTTALVCTSVNLVTATATFTNAAPIAIPDDSLFVKEGSYGLSIAGTGYLIDDSSTGEIFGIARSSDSKFKALVDRSGGSLTVAKMNYLVQQYKHKKGADKWNPRDFVIVTNPAQFGAYLNLGDPTVNATNSGVRLVDTVKNKGLDFGYNHSSVYFQGIEIIEDDNCPPDQILFIHKPSFYKGEFLPLRPYSLVGDGNQLNAIPVFDSSGVGTYLDQALYFLGWKGNTYTDDPSAHFKLDDLSITSLADGRV